jgi:hypothetical protein
MMPEVCWDTFSEPLVGEVWTIWGEAVGTDALAAAVGNDGFLR